MEANLNILSDPQAVCNTLMTISSRFKVSSKGSFGVIGAIIDPEEFDKTVLLESLRIIDTLILPRANDMSRGVERPNPEVISELISLSFSDTIFDIKEFYGLGREIHIPLFRGIP